MTQVESLIGLTGNASNGKDYVAGLFEERGYVHVSASDVLREIIVARGQTPNRELQTETANEFRALRGGDFFVREALRKGLTLQKGEPISLLVSGIYAPAEGAYVRRAGGLLLGVQHQNCDVEDSYKRIVSRSDGARDNISLDQFQAAISRENSGVDEKEANVATVMSMADYVIVNDGKSRRLLEEQIDSILQEKEAR